MSVSNCFGDGSVTLAWDANPEPGLAGYVVYFGTASGRYANRVDVGNVTTNTVTGLKESTDYYFAVTAYNSSRLESDYSNEISYRLPSANQIPPPDFEAPTSAVTAPAAIDSRNIPVTWSGTDAGRGIAWFNIYVSDNGAPFALWVAQTTLLGAVYSGVHGHHYAFYSVAVDKAGNTEAAPVLPDVTTFVREPNHAPVIAPAGPFTINEGRLFRNIFAASDVDRPTNVIRWSLGVGAPSGANIDPNSGQFAWTPTPLQGPSTNMIRIVATDNGVPALAGEQIITMIVRDSQGDFIFSVGATNLFAGESNSVPLLVTAGVDLASVSFLLTTDETRLTHLLLENISPQVASATLVPTGSNAVAISLTAFPGLSLPVGHPLAWFACQAVPMAASAYVRLQPIELIGQRTGGELLRHGLVRAGRVVVIGEAPLVEALPRFPPELALWGLPSQTYLIEFTAAPKGYWYAWKTVVASGPMTLVPARESLSPVFYRAIMDPTEP